MKKIINNWRKLIIESNGAMFQGDKKIDPSSLPSVDMGPVQPIIDDFNKLCSMLQATVESSPEAADLCNKINLELGRLADSIEGKSLEENK